MLLYQTLVTSCNYSVVHFFFFWGRSARARLRGYACVCMCVCVYVVYSFFCVRECVLCVCHVVGFGEAQCPN